MSLVLSLTAGACNTNTGIDTNATVNAVSTSVQLTVGAWTPTPGELPPPGITTIAPTTSPLTQPPPPIPTTAAAPTVMPLITSTPLARANGPILRAINRVSNPPTIDGQLNDWDPLSATFSQAVYQANNWSGALDQSVAYALAWDTNYLYLIATVVDDAHVQTQHKELIFRGDSLEILLDANLAGDFTSNELSSDDYQLGLSPGDFGVNAPEAYRWFPSAQAGALELTLAAQASGNGYVLEAAIPWSVFNLTPKAGDRYGFALSSSDNDTPNTANQQTMISNVSTRRLTDPTTWGTLELER